MNEAVTAARYAARAEPTPESLPQQTTPPTHNGNLRAGNPGLPSATSNNGPPCAVPNQTNNVVAYPSGKLQQHGQTTNPNPSVPIPNRTNVQNSNMPSGSDKLQTMPGRAGMKPVISSGRNSPVQVDKPATTVQAGGKPFGQAPKRPLLSNDGNIKNKEAGQMRTCQPGLPAKSESNSGHLPVTIASPQNASNTANKGRTTIVPSMGPQKPQFTYKVSNNTPQTAPSLQRTSSGGDIKKYENPTSAMRSNQVEINQQCTARKSQEAAGGSRSAGSEIVDDIECIR